MKNLPMKLLQPEVSYLVHSQPSRLPIEAQRGAWNLQADGLEEIERKQIAHGMQIRLKCGAVLIRYDNGTEMVQGKADAYCISLLKQMLPSCKRWYVTTDG